MIGAGASAKIDQLVHLLTLTPAKEKSLVFSQFTSFLDKVSKPYGRHKAHLSMIQIEEALEERGSVNGYCPRVAC
jgi:SWI/SNF-related matrix-associated actin-dependent regulator of chromatin subfamily A3